CHSYLCRWFSMAAHLKPTRLCAPFCLHLDLVAAFAGHRSPYSPLQVLASRPVQRMSYLLRYRDCLPYCSSAYLEADQGCRTLTPQAFFQFHKAAAAPFPSWLDVIRPDSTSTFSLGTDPEMPGASAPLTRCARLPGVKSIKKLLGKPDQDDFAQM